MFSYRPITDHPITICPLGGHVYFDLLGLGLFAERQLDRQDAVPVLGLDPVGIDRVRQRKRPGKCAVAPLDAVELLVLDRLLGLFLTTDGEREVFDRDVEPPPCSCPESPP